MAPQLVDADHQLISKLMGLSKAPKAIVRSSTYEAPADPAVTVRSWKMSEFKYYVVPSPFPTLARGLFTTWASEDAQSKEGDEKGMHRIVARGYDKFFNIGEVPWTAWDTLEKYTSPPYVMTLKSNGCIIFIAPLSPTKLLITSKHSLGPINGVDISHAQMGEKWLLKHLEDKGKTTEQLAQVLWDNNWTAVAELCDDSFEEHVLPYSSEKTGLHLHGINDSTGAFNTLPSEDVAAFAREWGLIETPYHNVNTIAEVRAFSDGVAEKGKWNGEEIEGFVVRCHVAQGFSSKERDAPPYPSGSSFFFKVKYDEPYMTYRDWREITKKLLSAKGPLRDVSVPKSKLRRPESELYLRWVRGEIARDREQFEGFNKGKGIIATRERFLKWMQNRKVDSAEVDELAGALSSLDVKKEKKNGPKKKTIIVPIAVPGCGKTTVAVALKQLFGFGHVQSDDVYAKKPAPVFLKRVADALEEHDVVIADKNNHLQQHRSGLRQAAEERSLSVQLLALKWTLDKPPAMVHRICSDRVLGRGDKHQSLRADDARQYEQVIWMFIGQLDELADSEVDEVVEMDIEDDLERNLDTAVDACVRVLGVPKPSAEEVGRALAAAREYAPVLPERAPKKTPPPRGKVRYFALLPEAHLRTAIEERLTERDAPAEMLRFWRMLAAKKRIFMSAPHVTLVHENEKEQAAEKVLWKRCESLAAQTSPPPPMFEADLGELLCDGRLMAVTVHSFRAAVDPGEDTSAEAVKLADAMATSERRTEALHITVGTKEHIINAVEAGVMVKKWKSGESKGDIMAIPFRGIPVKGRIKGMSH
ncbi:hypothetical protein M0805_001816 [Coniferiporia weirii]|nr:hypothetical protein M0805_001816 [Coniferiporia weirii]